MTQTREKFATQVDALLADLRGLAKHEGRQMARRGGDQSAEKRRQGATPG